MPQLRRMLQADDPLPVFCLRQENLKGALPNISAAAACVPQVPSRAGRAGVLAVRVSLPLGGKLLASQ